MPGNNRPFMLSSGPGWLPRRRSGIRVRRSRGQPCLRIFFCSLFTTARHRRASRWIKPLARGSGGVTRSDVYNQFGSRARGCSRAVFETIRTQGRPSRDCDAMGVHGRTRTAAAGPPDRDLLRLLDRDPPSGRLMRRWQRHPEFRGGASNGKRKRAGEKRREGNDRGPHGAGKSCATPGRSQTDRRHHFCVGRSYAMFAMCAPGGPTGDECLRTRTMGPGP